MSKPAVNAPDSESERLLALGRAVLEIEHRAIRDLMDQIDQSFTFPILVRMQTPDSWTRISFPLLKELCPLLSLLSFYVHAYGSAY